MFRYIRQLVQKLKKDKKVETQDSSSHSDGNTHVARSFSLKETEREIFWYYFPTYVILYSYLFCLLVVVLLCLYFLLWMLNIVEI